MTRKYYASRCRRYVHPKTMEQYRREWGGFVRHHERQARWAFEQLEDAIQSFKADPDHLGWVRSISGEAAKMKRERFEADKYQRLLDGRPTLAEERDAHCRAFEARMDAEAHRERNGGWADDEFNARYDDVRERYGGGES